MFNYSKYDGRKQILVFKDLIYFQREGKREKERERNIDVQEKHQLVASCAPHPGPWPANQACALRRN